MHRSAADRVATWMPLLPAQRRELNDLRGCDDELCNRGSAKRRPQDSGFRAHLLAPTLQHSRGMTNQFETIELATLDGVNGGVDWGMTHTVLTQGLSCAGGGALIGAMSSGPVGAAVGAVAAGGACAATSYLAMRQQAQQPAAQPAAASGAASPK